MYEKWLDDDGVKMQDTKSRIKELKDKIDAVVRGQEAHSDALDGKEQILSEKEDVLTDLHVQLRQKNTMMKQMKMQIRKLNGTLPDIIDKQPDDDDWAW
jgi:predicted nuclease with TOPRIM domain